MGCCWTSDKVETADLFENKHNEVYDHHEHTELFQNKFHNDKKVFKETLKNLGNLLLEPKPQLYHTISSKLLDQKLSNLLNVKNTSEIINLICLLESV